MRVLLQQIDWARLNRETRRQVRNRETYCPPISLFRWWARRPNSLIGTLLEATNLKRGALVSDPFSGGGTVALEAALRGLRVYAQDISPWAAWGVSTALDGIAPEDLSKGIENFIAEVSLVAKREYLSQCPEHGQSEVTHTFWVRECICQRCHAPVFLFPYSLLTLASRRSDERAAFYGCSSCGRSSRQLVRRPGKCPECRSSYEHERKSLLPGKSVVCLSCGARVAYNQIRPIRPRWRQTLVRRLCAAGKAPQTHFDVPTIEERVRRLRRCDIPLPLRTQIPPGHETGVLLRTGFKYWCDLYPARQLNVLRVPADY
jgi:putative DNA methylase